MNLAQSPHELAVIELVNVALVLNNRGSRPTSQKYKSSTETWTQLAVNVAPRSNHISLHIPTQTAHHDFVGNHKDATFHGYRVRIKKHEGKAGLQGLNAG